MTRATVSADGETITVHIPLMFRKRGGRKLVVMPGERVRRARLPTGERLRAFQLTRRQCTLEIDELRAHSLDGRTPDMTGLSALDRAAWLNPPPLWNRTNEALTLETGERTDFWRDTLYGFRRDSGHALLVPADGDFTAHVGFDGDYEALYDQAGLMLRRDEAHWIKAGIELSDGVANLSVVVTRGASDWSTVALGQTLGPQRLRLTRIGGAVIVQARNAVNRWQLLRVTPFPEAPAQIGPMACSPERAGFRARFTEFAIGPAVAQALHDESPAS